MNARRAWVAGVLMLLVCATGHADERSLLLLGRSNEVDRNAVIAAGVTVVAEMNDCFLAVGDAERVAAAAAGLGISAEVIDASVDGASYALVAPRPGFTEGELATCGWPVWSGDGWYVVRAGVIDAERCASRHWFWRPLDLEPMQPAKAPPGGLVEAGKRLEVKPLVQEMVNQTTSPLVVGSWTDLVGSASTRYSDRPGCTAAAGHVHSVFDSLGLTPEYQQYRSDWAPNVVGTLEGVSNPDQVYVVVGHLDDRPDSSTAPGADDNGSGSAMVVSAARVMSRYRFASTVKFLAVTGEEQGLVGSDHYARDAAARGENILAVLNADMNGWEGDGFPAQEDLDLPYNSDSAWLATLFTQAAADYGTGCPVNLLLCPNMAYSDHWSFWQEGWSGILGITDDEGLCGSGGSYPYYHSSDDTIANCGDPAFYVSSVRAFVATAAHLADPLCRMPDPPTGLTAVADGPNRIALDWDDPGASVTFEIYRAPGGCGGSLAYYLVGETSSSSWVDTTASGGFAYAYVVRGLDDTGYCLSEPSSCAEATTTGDCLEPPAFAGVTSVVDDHAAQCTLTVDWDEAQPYCGASATYNVYRSTSAGFTPDDGNRVAGAVVGTSYADSTGLVSGTPYHYIVRAVDVDNGAEDGNTVQASGAPTGPLTVGTWSDNGGDTGSATLELEQPWHAVTTGGVGNSRAYATGDYGNGRCSGAVTPPLYLATGAQLSFWSRYDIEADWDKGEVQLSTDGGASWLRLEVQYPAYASQTSDQCGLPAGDYFTGSDSTYREYTASLDAWAGQEVELRWVISSDGAVTGSGWWVDDITITQTAVPGACETQGDPPVFEDGFESGDTSAWAGP